MLYELFSSNDAASYSPDEFIDMFSKGREQFFKQFNFHKTFDEQKTFIVNLSENDLLRVIIDKRSDNTYKLCIYFVNLVDTGNDCEIWLYKTFLPLMDHIKSLIHLWPHCLFDDNIFVDGSNKQKDISLIFLSNWVG